MPQSTHNASNVTRHQVSRIDEWYTYHTSLTLVARSKPALVLGHSWVPSPPPPPPCILHAAAVVKRALGCHASATNPCGGGGDGTAAAHRPRGTAWARAWAWGSFRVACHKRTWVTHPGWVRAQGSSADVISLYKLNICI